MRKLITVLLCCLTPALALAIQPEIRPGAPERHVVVKGDTLWGIADKYFKHPWRWPQLWAANRDSIKNPHRIYPHQSLSLGLAAPASPRPVPSVQVQPKPVPVITARVISIYGGVSRAGEQTILVLDKGWLDGVENGQVLALYLRDRKTGGEGSLQALPERSYGLVRVFRTFSKTSYAVVTQTSLRASLLDTAKTVPMKAPEARALQANIPVSIPNVSPDRPDVQDARKCLELASNREIAACAEKYRQVLFVHKN